jgi:hypothetical protein
MDLEAFRKDPKTVAAVERKLLLVSEAAMRLGAEAERLCPGLPWHNIRGIGNWPNFGLCTPDGDMSADGQTIAYLTLTRRSTLYLLSGVR